MSWPPSTLNKEAVVLMNEQDKQTVDQDAQDVLSRAHWLMKWEERMRKAHGFPVGRQSWISYLCADRSLRDVPRLDEAEPKVLALAVLLAAKLEHEMGRSDAYDYKAITRMLEVVRR